KQEWSPSTDSLSFKRAVPRTPPLSAPPTMQPRRSTDYLQQEIGQQQQLQQRSPLRAGQAPTSTVARDAQSLRTQRPAASPQQPPNTPPSILMPPGTMQP